MSHPCPVSICTRTLPDHLLMCRPHWYMVPGDLRTAVWGAYRNGAGVGTLALWQAQADAIRAVHDQLGPCPRQHVHKKCGGTILWDLSGGYCLKCHAEGLDMDDAEPLVSHPAP